MEIEFRGKDIDTGKWRYGYYIKHQNRTLCAIGDELKEEDITHYIAFSGFSDWNMPRKLLIAEVDGDTVGQYINLKDKFNNKIYEGDKIKRPNVLRPTGLDKHYQDQFLIVKNDGFGFMFENIKYNKNSVYYNSYSLSDFKWIKDIEICNE